MKKSDEIKRECSPTDTETNIVFCCKSQEWTPCKLVGINVMERVRCRGYLEIFSISVIQSHINIYSFLKYTMQHLFSHFCTASSLNL